MVAKTVATLRKNTEGIVALNPANIVLHRLVKTFDPDGTEVITPTTITTQLMRIAEISNAQTDNLMEQGNIVTHIVNVTAFFNTDIQDLDRFNYLGKNYEIIFIRPISIFGQEIDNIYKRSGRAREISETV